jgi:hypothetical protein
MPTGPLAAVGRTATAIVGRIYASVSLARRERTGATTR